MEEAISLTFNARVSAQFGISLTIDGLPTAFGLKANLNCLDFSLVGFVFRRQCLSVCPTVI
jgi:hypothetical protein